jgi:hypothetical protein
MMVDLEERIKKRIVQAEQRKIAESIRTVAKGLGKPYSGVSSIGCTYTAGDLTVMYADEVENVGFLTKAKYKGKEVFVKDTGQITTYIPGTRTWEKALSGYVDAAQAALEEKRSAYRKETARRLSQRAQRFGL